MKFVADQGLLRYIRERLSEGYSEEEIREALLSSNHEADAVAEALHAANHHARALPVIFGLLVLIGIGVSLFLYLQPATVEPIVQQPTQPIPKPPSQGVITLASELQQQELEGRELYYRSVELAVLNARTSGDGILICSVNEDIVEKNYCLSELAGERRDPLFCEIIGDTRQRDDCYLGLILDGEDQYCQELILNENQQVCDILLS